MTADAAHPSPCGSTARAAPECSYPETRIGAFDFSVATGTEAFAFLSGSAHRASIDSCREVTTDLGQYTQPDPIGLRGGTNLFGYAAQNPLTSTDPSGLLTCRCSRHLEGGGMASDVLGTYHVYLRIGPAPKCEDNPSYGFTHDVGGAPGLGIVSFRGRVDTNDPNRKQELCSAVPCMDDKKALERVVAGIKNPGTYICAGRNCYWFVNTVLDYARIPGCCESPKQK